MWHYCQNKAEHQPTALVCQFVRFLSIHDIQREVVSDPAGAAGCAQHNMFAAHTHNTTKYSNVTQVEKYISVSEPNVLLFGGLKF